MSKAKNREPLVIAYDRTTRLDVGAMVGNRELSMERTAKKIGLEITKFIIDEEPANFSEQHELHKLLDFARERPQELVLIAVTPYRLIKAGLKVMVPVLAELCNLAAMVLFAGGQELGGCQSVRWAAEVQKEIAAERAATIRARQRATGYRTVGRPRLPIDDRELRRYYKRHKSLRKTARLLGVSLETVRRRLREISGKENS